MRDKIAAMKRSDPEGHADFVRFLSNEQKMFKTYGELGNSPTAERLGNTADTDGLIGDLASAAVQAGTGRPREAIRAVWSTLKKVDPEKRGRVMNEARRVLLNPDPDEPRFTWPHPVVRPQYLSTLSDERLIATVLGERLGFTEPRRQDPAGQALNGLEIDTRASIRGCFVSIDNVRAGRAPTGGEAA